ncbi:hypothetical protein GMOD_00010423 [Pyrenophora seminiperda CCB06]|uniref:Uncharacterized protein n=1 Tax=Pyrenophora seminiperda CCB06 TaxID=1302712 RepID=A0A3M7LZZ2_9PLEO|nr:hypothetical protein GMOD_00010423 [Pyrenophora seminiperda CCB06]
MQREHDDDARVKRPHGRAVVVKLLATQMRQRLALAVHSRHEHVKRHLHDAEGRRNPHSSGPLCA